MYLSTEIADSVHVADGGDHRVKQPLQRVSEFGAGRTEGRPGPPKPHVGLEDAGFAGLDELYEGAGGGEGVR